jgi:hypothetical protein
MIALKKPVWVLEKLNNILLHSAVSFSFLILWRTSCDTQFTHLYVPLQCLLQPVSDYRQVHSNVSCILYPTTDSYATMSLTACIWLQTFIACTQQCLLQPVSDYRHLLHVHSNVSCSLYLTTDIYCMYTAMSLAVCIWLQTFIVCTQQCFFLILFLIKYFMH